MQRNDDRGFEVVVRREGGRDDLAFLGVAPVVVGENQRAGFVAQFEGGICQEPLEAEVGEGRTDRAQDHLFRARAAHDKAADEDIVARPHLFPGRDIELPRGDDDRRRVVRIGRERNSERLSSPSPSASPSGSAGLRIVDLRERQARGLEAGEIDMRRDPDPADKRIGIAGAGIDPDRHGRDVGAGRRRDAEIIAQHITGIGQRGEAGVGRLTR